MTVTVRQHEGVMVVRDDEFPGGTKARFLPALFDGASYDEVVYASPCEGGAQTAIATVAAALGKKATIFVAQRKKPHPRTLMAKRLGAKVLQVGPAGYLSVVQARAKAYAAARGARLLPFGLNVPEAIAGIASAARTAKLGPREVWCAGGSGVLARALRQAFPDAKLHVVQVGHALDAAEIGATEIHICDLKFGDASQEDCPFPSDPHYDRKAWHVLMRERPDYAERRDILFWNVTGPADA